MKPKICLNMIVKDESAVIERSIASVKPLIDSWCIVDTGSSDDTKEKIQAALADLPGKLYERPWRSMGENRTEALELAKEHGEFLLLTDASFVWVPKDTFKLPDLTEHDAYFGKIKMSGTSWYLPMIIRAHKNWYFDSESHAGLYCKEGFVQGPNLKNIVVEARGDGSRRSKEDSVKKYERDIEVFTAQIAANPRNTRAMFYLAQSYRDVGRPRDAAHWYLQRSQAGGWAEEVWFSHYRMGAMRQQMGSTWPACEAAYLAAYAHTPSRAEPLIPLSRHYRAEKNYAMANLYATAARDIVYPEDALLFVEDAVYEWQALDEYAVSAYRVGKYAKSAEACEILLNERDLPGRERMRIEQNLKFAKDKLG